MCNKCVHVNICGTVGNVALTSDDVCMLFNHPLLKWIYEMDEAPPTSFSCNEALQYKVSV